MRNCDRETMALAAKQLLRRKLSRKLAHKAVVWAAKQSLKTKSIWQGWQWQRARFDEVYNGKKPNSTRLMMANSPTWCGWQWQRSWFNEVNNGKELDLKRLMMAKSPTQQGWWRQRAQLNKVGNGKEPNSMRSTMAKSPTRQGQQWLFFLEGALGITRRWIKRRLPYCLEITT